MMSSTEWRSPDANSDFCLDDSIASTINSSFLSSNTQKDGNSSFTSEEGLLNALSNLSIESAQKQRRSKQRSSLSDQDLDDSFEDCQDLSSNTQIDVSINNTVIQQLSQSADVDCNSDKNSNDNLNSENPINENLEASQNDNLLEADNIQKETSCNQVIDIPTNEHQESVTDSQITSDNAEEQKHTNIPDIVINDTPINSDDKDIPDVDKKKMSININKSINAMNQSIKKSKPASPSLLPKPKPRNITSALDQSVSKVSGTKPAAKHVVKTIVDTTDGIHVKEEQINHFGIPIIAGRKKRTEVQPFSFLTRGKSASTISKTSGSADKVISKTSNGTADKFLNKTLSGNTSRVINKTSIGSTSRVMNKSIAGMTDKMMTKTLTSASDKLVNKTLTAKRVSTIPSRVMDKPIKKPIVTSTTKTVTKSLSNPKITAKVNQENKTPNVIPKPKAQILPKPSGFTGPPKLHTDKRAKERHEFDEQIRLKQMEIDRLRAKWEEKQREKEKLEELALRKTMEPKAHPMPEFKAPAPIKSLKPLTVPQSPATWAREHKK